MMDWIKELTIGFALAVTVLHPEMSYITNDYLSVWFKDGYTTQKLQEITDEKDYGAHYQYGQYYYNDVFCDHCNQSFRVLKDVEIGDTLTLVYKCTVSKYKCTHIETMKVSDDGQIRDKNGNYMGEDYYPCIVLYTCKAKDRLVTIWEEIV